MCACTSTKPGTIVLPATSMTFAPAGTATRPLAPTATMRLPVTTTSARSSTSSPFIVATRAPVRTTVPVGRARGTSIDAVDTSGDPAVISCR